jgi:hypothetical protein
LIVVQPAGLDGAEDAERTSQRGRGRIAAHAIILLRDE